MNTTTLSSKKITMATVKSFIKANAADLWINVTSRFDGMTDMCELQNGGFTKVENLNGPNFEQTKGIRGAWFVGDSRDYFIYWNKNGFKGIEVYNSCGCFILAIKTNKQVLATPALVQPRNDENSRPEFPDYTMRRY